MFEPGSFRDPAGRVIEKNGQIFRAVFDAGAADFEAARKAGVLDRAIDEGRLLPMLEVPASRIDSLGKPPVHLLEHPKLPYVSYPYEWTFSALKKAALFHLDFHLSLLEDNFTLSDATAYNVQFQGTRPIFIDHLSIIPYHDGQLWPGQRQFAMMFLNPLLLWAKRGIAPNAWFRGSVEGIAPEELTNLLRWRDKLSFNVLSHVVAQARAHRSAVDQGASTSTVRSLPKRSFEAILKQLRAFIAGLALPPEKSVWGDYAQSNSYDEAGERAKHAFVSSFASQVRPPILFDIGCNSGDYSLTALDAGAEMVIGYDFDFGALERAFDRFDRLDRPILPLWLDAANPSPAQGWANTERKSFQQRAKADGLLALALVHHLAIGRNVPLEMVVDWLMSLAPAGIIEFPSKDDPMVHGMLSTRKDIFPDYDEKAFLAHVAARGKIIDTRRPEMETRLLVRYERM